MFLLSLQLPPPPPTATRVSGFLGKNKKRGFTLAETLITLGIIGIIAAMTVPNLISNYHKSLWETNARRAYSLLSNRLKIVIAEKGCSDIDCAYSATSSIDEFVHDLFPDAEELSQETLTNIPVELLDGTKTHLGYQGMIYGNDYMYGYLLPKAHMLLLCKGGAFRNWWDELSFNPETPVGEARGYCSFVTEYPTKKIIFGRNLFMAKFLNDGRWIPRYYFDQKNHKYYYWVCHDGTRRNSYTESCLSRLLQNGWKMDY